MKDAGLALLTLALEPEGNGRDRETVEWVEAARAWVPPADLATRQVQVEWAVKDWIQAGKVGAAYFSPSWTAFQADRGQRFSVIVDAVSG